MRIVFMGTPQAAVPALRRCLSDGHEVVSVWTQPDRPAGRHNKLTASPVKEFGLVSGIPVFQPSKIKTQETLELFKSQRPDVAVVVAYGRILPETLLAIPKFGCINVHFSLLPAYRGAAPVNWAIVRGETHTGVTTMLMEAGLDTGPVLLQTTEMILGHETATSLMARLADAGADLLGETLLRFDKLVPSPQDGERATFAPMLKREDGKIDWDLDAFQIDRRVRGFQPWPNAFTLHENRRLVIWESEAISSRDVSKLNGSVIDASGDNLIVASGDGSALQILEIQPEGKRRMKVKDFLNGVQLPGGTILG